VLQERGLQRRVRLEVDDWFRLLALVQRGVGISYGPEACIDRTIFPGLAVATLAGAPRWEVGVAYRGETLRGAAGRAFLTAYRQQWQARKRALEDDDHSSDNPAQMSS
jgi:DNA-binding transcriptional LysR family regulator